MLLLGSCIAIQNFQLTNLIIVSICFFFKNRHYDSLKIKNKQKLVTAM